MKIKEWAEEDRPREKMLLKGSQSLSDAELLAILIGSGNTNETAVQLAQRILSESSNNLNELGKRTIQDLMNQFKGIGQAKAITILAALELGKRRSASDILQRPSITSSRDAFLLLHPLISDLPHEELWGLFLSRSNKVIRQVKISQGGVSETAADLRIILKAAVLDLASGVILAHNHPSGNRRPSKSDDLLTQRLKQSAQLLDISLLDHLILADNSYFSYADEGQL